MEEKNLTLAIRGCMNSCESIHPFYADYRVMLIDKDYTRALVGSSSADYLWLLSRSPGLSETAKSELLSEAKRRGYDTGKLIWVEQK